ncbi:MAG: hypothetical protein UT06_C0040G0001, partial [Candidatus Woesebacteria bacterium GW2011_GWA1_38_8]
IVNFIDSIGTILVLLSVFGISLTFGPVLMQEVKYQTKQGINSVLNSAGLSENRENIEEKSSPKEIVPPNTDFSIVIPKIEASAPVTANVDPFNEREFLTALRKGVAHAKGTSFPGIEGNTYIFAHSTDAFYNVGRYNAVFYLIGKLEKGDEVDVYYKGEKYVYIVYDKKVVTPEAIEYLNNVKGESRLTLQTCYPPGTTLRRLVVIAKLPQ